MGREAERGGWLLVVACTALDHHAHGIRDSKLWTTTCCVKRSGTCTLWNVATSQVSCMDPKYTCAATTRTRPLLWLRLTPHKMSHSRVALSTAISSRSLWRPIGSRLSRTDPCTAHDFVSYSLHCHILQQHH